MPGNTRASSQKHGRDAKCSKRFKFTMTCPCMHGEIQFIVIIMYLHQRKEKRKGNHKDVLCPWEHLQLCKTLEQHHLEPEI